MNHHYKPCLWAHKIRDVDFSFILQLSTTLSWKIVCGCYNLFDWLQHLTFLFSFFSCVELIVVEQMNKYKARLKDISSLEFAENKAKTRLSLIRRSMVRCRTWNHRGKWEPSSDFKYTLWYVERDYSPNLLHMEQVKKKKSHLISGYYVCLMFVLWAVFSYIHRIQLTM